MKWEIDSKKIILGDFNTPLIPMDRSSTKKINIETYALNHTLDQRGLIDIFRIFYHQTAEYIFFFQVHMKQSLEWITSWVTNQALPNLRN